MSGTETGTNPSVDELLESGARQLSRKADQRRIWRILADTMGVKISGKTIDAFSERHKALVGRDVKNLLKLSSLMAEGGEVTSERLEFALRFKPAGAQQ